MDMHVAVFSRQYQTIAGQHLLMVGFYGFTTVLLYLAQ